MKHIFLPGLSLALLLLLLLPGPCRAQAIAVDGGLVRESRMSPGERSDSRIVVRNVSPTMQRLRIYQMDYSFAAGGKTTYGAPGQAPRSNARWLTLAPNTLEIPVGGQDAIACTTAVPNEPALEGTYWSALMIEVVGEGGEQAGVAGKGPRAGLRTVIRYGLQMVTEIGDTGTREVSYLAAALTVKGQQRLLQVDLANTGQRALTPTVWAELFDDKGGRAGRFTGGKTRLYPGCSTRFEIDLSKVAPGDYKALVVSDNGDEHVFGAQYQLEIR